MKVSVSYLGVKNIIPTLEELDTTDVDYIHVDVMDGKYVRNKTLGFKDIEGIGYFTKKRLDIHFMVEKPLKYIDDYATLNVEYMTFHLDTKNDIKDVIKRCNDYGIKVGIAVNPQDDIKSCYPYLKDIALVLIMSVIPGLPGQEFMMEVLPKINELDKEIKNQKVDVNISVDGGINNDNKDLLEKADILVSGSFVTNNDDYQTAIAELRSIKKTKKDKA